MLISSTLLPGAVEIDDELLEEAGGEPDPHAVDLRQPPRRVMRALDDQLADLAKPSGPISAM